VDPEKMSEPAGGNRTGSAFCAITRGHKQYSAPPSVRQHKIYAASDRSADSSETRPVGVTGVSANLVRTTT
jgi:hypothetical protein